MTTKTDDIKLPPLPEWSKMDDLGGLVPSEVRVALAGYARAAVEADRQDHFRDAAKMVDQSGAVNEMVPSDEAIQVLAKQYDCHYAPGFMGFARALLSKYGNRHE